MKEGHASVADIQETAVEPPPRSSFVDMFTQKVSLTMRLIRAEYNAGFPRNKDLSSAIWTASFREHDRLDCERGVHCV